MSCASFSRLRQNCCWRQSTVVERGSLPSALNWAARGWQVRRNRRSRNSSRQLRHQPKPSAERAGTDTPPRARTRRNQPSRRRAEGRANPAAWRPTRTALSGTRRRRRCRSLWSGSVRKTPWSWPTSQSRRTRWGGLSHRRRPPDTRLVSVRSWGQVRWYRVIRKVIWRENRGIEWGIEPWWRGQLHCCLRWHCRDGM